MSDRRIRKGKGEGANGISEKSVRTRSTEEILADFVVRPNEVRVGRAHSFGAHHLLS